VKVFEQVTAVRISARQVRHAWLANITVSSLIFGILTGAVLIRYSAALE
jgi:hypothetical protein